MKYNISDSDAMVWYQASDQLIYHHLKVAREIRSRREHKFINDLFNPILHEVRVLTGGRLGGAYVDYPDPYYERKWWKNPLCWQFWRELPTEMRLRRAIKQVERRMYGAQSA